ncbi:GDSL-type esterase/lipase family protein [Desulforhopalus singaporensis]|nr:GDSL-type esterase/lipase family protein [Desulforhopalus singaporensis]
MKQIFMILGCAVVLLVLNSCTVKTSDKDARKTLAVLCIGDSLTSGYKLVSPGKQSYPSQLGKISQHSLTVTNLGVPGATILKKGDIPYWLSEELDTALSSHPDVIVLLLGTNDTKDCNWQYREQFTEDYIEMVRILQQLPSGPQIFLCSIPPVHNATPSGISNERVAQLTEEVREVARVTGTQFIDVTTSFENMPKLFIDGLHPTASGAGRIAEIVMKAVVKS